MREDYGLHRVIDEAGTLPQRARQLDPSLPIHQSELLIDVSSLNIDAASFRQLREESGGDQNRLCQRIAEIVGERGKMHNPVTQSGGMLIGTVREIGRSHPARPFLKSGDRIATLVSLTLTPLKLEEILAVDLSADRVDVTGHAILFATGIYAKLPADLPERLALAALDVCGAPAFINRYVKPGMTVGIIGAGKSGALGLAQARRNLGGTGQLLCIDISQKSLDQLAALALADRVLCVDATRPIAVMDAVSAATGGRLCDVVVNCASVSDTEMSAILSTRAGGTVIFFSMATHFATSALGAEGVGKDVVLLMGNGYVPGHAELTLELLRSNHALKQLFETRYVREQALIAH